MGYSLETRDLLLCHSMIITPDSRIPYGEMDSTMDKSSNFVFYPFLTLCQGVIAVLNLMQ